MVSPGDSSVPANRLPIITQDAPAASALEMSPEYLIPPSAMSGTSVPCAARAASMIAVNCGTPARSEEHTSELQSRLHLVCRLLLEKKKKTTHTGHRAH